MIRRPPRSTLFPLHDALPIYPMVKKSYMSSAKMRVLKPKLDAATSQYNKPEDQMQKQQAMMAEYAKYGVSPLSGCFPIDRKSTRLNSSHANISYAVFCLKKKK